MTATYEFLVEDVIARRFIGTLPLQNVTYEDWDRRPGKLTAKLPLLDADTNVELLDIGRRALYVRRNRVIEWGGLLLAGPVAMGAEDVQISALGWLGYWDSRDIWTDRQFTATDQFNIFKTLVEDAQDPAAVIDPLAGTTAGAGGDLGINVVWDSLSGVLRDREQEYRYFSGKNLGAALRQLGALENGFDYAMQYGYTDTAIVKEIKLFYPTRGSTNGDQPGFVYRRGQEGNVLRRSLGNDASALRTRMRGWGAGQDTGRLRSDIVDNDMRGIYPFFDGQGSFSSVIDQGPLDDNTAALFARNNRIVRLPGLEVDPDKDPRWGTYGIGDVWNVTIDDGAYVSSNGPHRIVGYKMDVDRDVPTLYVQEEAA